MNFLNKIFLDWKERNTEKRRKQEEILKEYVEFYKQSEPFFPKASKQQLAAAYSYIWKRAVVYQTICEKLLDDVEKAKLFVEFQNIASKEYNKIAPENAYGKVRLKLSAEAHKRMLDEELKRLKPTQENRSKRNLELACIYVGYDTLENKPYIWKTIGEPEYRWKEHRSCGTGPFKNGSSYAKWDVIRENVDLNDLNKLESYFIGFYNAFEDGHNDNRGNDLNAYEKGKRESQISILEK
jgi:hypothetical protein